MASRILPHLLVMSLTFNLLFFDGVSSRLYPYTVVESGPEDLTVVAGESATFSCDLNTASRNDVIWWLFESQGCFLYISRNGEPRPTCGININHYQSTIDHMHHIYTLQIDNVSEEDEGVYVCKNESTLRGAARLTVLPRNVTDPSSNPAGDCVDSVCCEISFFPTGYALPEKMEAQLKCSWPEKYTRVDIHAHMYCNGVEIRGSNKVMFADHAIAKLEPNQHNNCENFSCEVEIVGENSVQDSCLIRSDNNLRKMILRVEPETSFVEEGSDAIFFCHVNNVLPTSGSFHWYLVHTRYMSVNSISSEPIASTTGYYGKLQLSSVMLPDDFMTVKCFFEPDNYIGNYSKAGSNPAVLRVVRRATTQISCYTSDTSSLLRCTGDPDGEEDPKDEVNIWPMTTKEWILAGTCLGLLLIVILLCRPVFHRKSSRRRHEGRDRSMRMSESGLSSSGTQSDLQVRNDRYEYLRERHYDAPYSLLRNLRNFPRLLRNRVIHRDNARRVHPPPPQAGAHDPSPNLSYGSLDPSGSQPVTRRHRVIADDNPGRRASSDYDVLDATTMTAFQQPERTTSGLATPSAPDTTTTTTTSVPMMTSIPSTSNATSPSVPTTDSSRLSKKKPKVTPKPLLPRSVIQSSPRVPALPAEGANRIHQEAAAAAAAAGHDYVNVNDGYASPMASPVDASAQCRVGNDGYLEPNQENAYLDIC